MSAWIVPANVLYRTLDDLVFAFRKGLRVRRIRLPLALTPAQSHHRRTLPIERPTPAR